MLKKGEVDLIVALTEGLVAGMYETRTLKSKYI